MEKKMRETVWAHIDEEYLLDGCLTTEGGSGAAVVVAFALPLPLELGSVDYLIISRNSSSILSSTNHNVTDCISAEESTQARQ